MSVVWQYRKMMALAFLLLAAFALLAGQLVNLQVVRHEELLGLAANNTVRTIARDPMRGQILDIRGNPLATSIPGKLICADPSLLNVPSAAPGRQLPRRRGPRAGTVAGNQRGDICWTA